MPQDRRSMFQESIVSFGLQYPSYFSVLIVVEIDEFDSMRVLAVGGGRGRNNRGIAVPTQLMDERRGFASQQVQLREDKPIDAWEIWNGNKRARLDR